MWTLSVANSCKNLLERFDASRDAVHAFTLFATRYGVNADSSACH